MPDEGQATFNEVVSITADQSAFSDSLNALTEAYQEWIRQLSSSTSDIFEGSLTEAANALSNIGDQIGDLMGEFRDSLDQIADAMQGLAGQQADAVAQNIQAQLDGVAQVAAAQEAADAERAERQRALAAEMATQGATQASSGAQSSFTLFGSGLAEGLAEMVKIQLAWQAIGATIQGVTDLITAPFRAIEQGVEYMDEVNQQAIKLTGTLAANVQFSANLTENFQMASQAATQVTMRLQETAAATGIPLANLQRIFEILTTAGGAAVVQTTDQMVQLTQMVAMFEQAARGSNEMRSIVSDLPKLLNGTLQNTSALVTATGINADQWREIVAESKEHGDLVERLTPIFAPYLSATELAAQQHQNLTNQLKLQLTQLEALAAEPFYKQVTEWLKQIVSWTEENRDKLTAWAQAGSDVTAQFTHMLTLLTGETGIDAATQSILGKWLRLFAVLTGVAEKLAIVSNISLGVSELDSRDKAVEGILRLSKGIADFKNNLAGVDADVQRTFADVNAAINTPAGSQKKPSILDQHIEVKGNHPSTDKSPAPKKDYKGEYEEQLAILKSYYDDAIETVQDGEARLEISKRDGAALITAIDDEEIQRVQAASAKYKDAISKFYDTQIQAGKATQQDLANALAQADAQAQNQITALQKTTAGAQRGGDQEGADVAKINATSRLNQIKESYKEQLAYEKDALQQEYETEVQYLDKSQDIRDRQHQAEIAAIDAQMSHISASNTLYATLMSQRAMVDAQYSAQWMQYYVERQAAEQRNAQQQREHTLTMRELDRQSISENIGALGKATGRNYGVAQDSLTDQGLADKQRELELQLQILDAKMKSAGATALDVDNGRKLVEQLAQIRNERTATVLKQVATEQGSTDPQFFKDQQSREMLQQRYNQLQAEGPLKGEDPQAFKDSLDQLKHLIDAYTPSLDNALQQLKDKLAGFDLSGVIQKIQNDPNLTDSQKTLGEFAAGLQATSNALTTMKGVVNDVISGLKQGGVAGGIGAGITDAAKLAPDLLESIPVIGQFMPAIGGLLSFFGSLFTQTANEIAQQVQKSVQTITANYQEGNATLSQTITALQQERQAAISSLSGVKGGQDKLDQLLPQLDQQIASLEMQQKQVVEQFDLSLQSLQTQSTTLEQIQQQWDQIVQTVQQYLSAGGDAVAAQQYLSLQLQAMQKQAQDQLNQGNDQAVQDAINLNNLLEQRNNLQLSYNQQVFDLTNQDAIERDSGAVSRAEQVQLLNQQYQQQLSDLNYQIDLTAQKVSLESQIFDIATDINTLHQQDDALQLAALQEQLQGYQDLKNVIGSIWQQSDGTFTSNNPLLTSNPSVIVNINGNIVGINANDPYAAGQQIGQGLSESIINALTNGGSSVIP